MKTSNSLLQPLNTWLEGKVLVKYALTGVGNTLVDFAVFTLLLCVGVAVEPANLLAFLAGCVNSYVVNRNFTFRARAKASGRNEFGRIALFACVTAICTAISYLTFHVMVPLAGPYGAKMCSMAGVLAVGFFLNRTFVFRPMAEG